MRTTSKLPSGRLIAELDECDHAHFKLMGEIVRDEYTGLALKGRKENNPVFKTFTNSAYDFFRIDCLVYWLGCEAGGDGVRYHEARRIDHVPLDLRGLTPKRFCAKYRAAVKRSARASK